MNKILFKNSNFQLILFEHTTLMCNVKVFKVFFIFWIIICNTLKNFKNIKFVLKIDFFLINSEKIIFCQKLQYPILTTEKGY